MVPAALSGAGAGGRAVRQDGGGIGRGRRVLVVEDEFLIALDVAGTLAALGCEVLGPVPSVAHALALLAREVPDFAILDVNLGGERTAALAQALRDRGVPFALSTGYDPAQLPEPAFQGAALLGKPLDPQRLCGALAALGRAAGG